MYERIKDKYMMIFDPASVSETIIHSELPLQNKSTENSPNVEFDHFQTTEIL